MNAGYFFFDGMYRLFLLSGEGRKSLAQVSRISGIQFLPGREVRHTVSRGASRGGNIKKSRIRSREAGKMGSGPGNMRKGDINPIPLTVTDWQTEEVYRCSEIG